MNTNVKVTLTKADTEALFLPELNNEDIEFVNVIKVAVGSKLIWIEYFEDDNLRYRAYGRYEFANIAIQSDDSLAIFPVGDETFKAFTYNNSEVG